MVNYWLTKFQVEILNGFRVTSDTHINEVKVLTRALSAQRCGRSGGYYSMYYIE